MKFGAIAIGALMASALLVAHSLAQGPRQLSPHNGEAYLAENAAKGGVTQLASGLQIETIKAGSGPMPTPADTVVVQYEGALTDGSVFDSSYQRGEPAQFPVSGVIPGMAEGLQHMQKGGSYRLVIPSELAYGAAGAGGVIPPNAVLTFKIELLDIVKGGEAGPQG